MFSPYEFLKKEAINLINTSISINASPFDIKPCQQGFELSTPLPLIMGEDAETLVKKLKSSHFFESIVAVNNHICFKVSKEAYEYCTKKIISEEENLLPALESISSDAEYAYMRMRMLAQNESDKSVYDDKSVQHALWSAFSLASEKPYVHDSVQKALSIGETLSPKERFTLKKSCGKVGLCIAILLYRHIK